MSVPPLQEPPVQEIVRAASLAPSPDNNQPWRFVAGGQKLHVFSVGQRELPSDVGSMFGLMALGAAAENAVLEAGRLGWSAEVQLLRPPPSDEPILEIQLQPGGQGEDLAEYLEARCTNRRMYPRASVSPEELATVGESLGACPGARVDWVTSPKAIAGCGRLVAASDLIRFQYRPFHEELFKQLRLDAASAQATRDGLDYRTLELPPGVCTVLRMLRPWQRMRWLHAAGLGWLLTIPSAASIKKSGAVGVLTVDDSTPGQLLLAGRAFQRIWLRATAVGLSLHPLGSLPIFLAHLELGDTSPLAGRHLKQLTQLQADLLALVPAVQSRKLVMLFRLGRSRAPSHRSLRLPLADVLHSESDAEKLEGL